MQLIDPQLNQRIYFFVLRQCFENLKCFFSDKFVSFRADHQNIDILWLGIGNMPNMGMFFIRGEYVTKYNTVSNRTVVNSVHETKMNNAAGNL